MRRLAKTVLLTIGRMIATVIPGRDCRGAFFFFPVYHLGGAEVVHAEILALTSHKKPWIVICSKSNSSALKERFGKTGRVIDISPVLGNTLTWVVFIGYFSKVINSFAEPMVFGSNCYFFYELLPFLGPHVHKFDLVHSFGAGIEDISLPRVPLLDRRIVIDKVTFGKMKAQYVSGGLGKDFLDRIDLVENKVAIPEVRPGKNNSQRLQIYYVGRGTGEKRVHLVGRIACQCRRYNLPVDITLVGDVMDAVDAKDREHCKFLGGQCPELMGAMYQKADLLLITSSREGFPMVIMEGMAYGVVPLATDVGGIASHLRNGVNGFLVADNCDEEMIVAEFVDIIRALVADRPLLSQLSEAAYKYAAANFGNNRFDQYYRNLFNN